MDHPEIEPIKQRLAKFYQANKRSLFLFEKRYLETPTEELRLQCAEIRGVLRGIQKAIFVVNDRMNDNPLPGLFEAG